MKRWSAEQERRREIALAAVAKRQDALPDPVEREPCPRCATRGDIGCKHRPASGSKPVEFAPEPPDKRIGQPQFFRYREKRG